jgi:CubicO group peptidase (beta-lactamase class C family)
VQSATARRVERVNAAGFGYGYQWWRIDRDGVAIWAGLGFGGQFLVVMPERQIVGVINSWNVFGGGQPAVLAPFLQALLTGTAPS